MSRRLRWIVLGALAAPCGPALASGGGSGGMGGGMTPSVEAPQYDPVAEFQKGDAAFQAGKYKDAAHYFEHAADAEPSVAMDWYRLGQARAAAGDIKGSLHPLEKAVKLDPAPVDARRDYAVSLAKLKQTDKAAAQLSELKARAAACNDTCAQAADLKAAVASVEAALAPGGPTAWLTAPAGPALASVNMGDASYVRAVSLINERRYEEALLALDKAQMAFGPHPDILTYKGYVWRKLGQLDRAESYYKAALAVAPNHRGATEYYGELKVIRGDLAGARLMLTRLDAQCAFGCVEAEDLRRWIARGGDPAS